jgi:hypothetical protein
MADAIATKYKIRGCWNCPNLSKDWKCNSTQESIFLQSECPENRWDKAWFPSSKEEIIKLGVIPMDKPLLDELGAVIPENLPPDAALPANFKKLSLSSKPHKNLLTPKSSLEDIIYCVENYPPGGWISSCHTWANFQKAYRLLCAKKAGEIICSPYPKERFKGRGIVICGGGPKYYPSVYVNARMLRLLGCNLPIEVYYLGNKEMDYKMKDILESIGNLKCIDATSFESKYPIRIHGGWESKVYSIINSSFEEVLMIDADNTPLRNPEYIFDSEPYKKFGTVFWPDYECWVHDKNMWEILGIPYRDELQVESGQILINKSRCWHEINMAKYFCDYSDYYFKLFYGDKETFHFGWRFLGSDYGFPSGPDWVNDSVILQKDFDGAWLFSHRAQAKFKMDKSHKISLDIPYEKDTLELLDELGFLWSGQVWLNNNPSEEEKEEISKIENKTLEYIRLGIDQRKIEFLPNGVIGVGAARLEKRWSVFVKDKVKILSILGDEGLTALLFKEGDEWCGKWMVYEKCGVLIK